MVGCVECEHIWESMERMDPLLEPNPVSLKEGAW